MEFSFIELAAPAVSSYTSALIATTDMSDPSLDPPSQDPSGLTHIVSSNTLLMCDGGVEKTVGGVTHFEGINMREMTLDGGVVGTANSSKVAPTLVLMTNDNPIPTATYTPISNTTDTPTPTATDMPTLTATSTPNHTTPVTATPLSPLNPLYLFLANSASIAVGNLTAVRDEDIIWFDGINWHMVLDARMGASSE